MDKYHQKKQKLFNGIKCIVTLEGLITYSKKTKPVFRRKQKNGFQNQKSSIEKNIESSTKTT
jgi:hypothetical protein